MSAPDPSAEFESQKASRRARESLEPAFERGSGDFLQFGEAACNPYRSNGGFNNDRYFWFQGYYHEKYKRFD